MWLVDTSVTDFLLYILLLEIPVTLDPDIDRAASKLQKQLSKLNMDNEEDLASPLPPEWSQSRASPGPAVFGRVILRHDTSLVGEAVSAEPCVRVSSTFSHNMSNFHNTLVNRKCCFGLRGEPHFEIVSKYNMHNYGRFYLQISLDVLRLALWLISLGNRFQDW